MVVRIPGGFFKCGDPWHSQSMKCNGCMARLAPGHALERAGRGGIAAKRLARQRPDDIFEHRSLLDGGWARRPYPGDDFVVPFGKASLLREGTELTVVTWGRDGGTLRAGDRGQRPVGGPARPTHAVAVGSCRRRWPRCARRRCLIVHEDTMTAGFGAEIAAVLAKEAFFDLDAPIERLAMPDVPSPHNPLLLDAVLPSIETIARVITELFEI